MSKIEVNDICKKFVFKNCASVKVLEGVSFSLNDNEVLGIIGPSGCGKTTLLYIIAGYLAYDSGSLLHNGSSIIAPSPERTVIFQEYALFPWMTVKENIEFGLKTKGVPKDIREKTIQRQIELIHLKGFENKYPHQLSGGMKQRVGIARALAIDPEVILMDEPFAALDSLTRDIMQEEVLKIWEKTKKSMLLITHNIEEAIFLSDRVMIMTARPGRKKEIINVDLPHPRCQEIKSSAQFLRIKNYISQSLRKETLKGIEEMGIKLTKNRGNIKVESLLNKKEV